MVSTTHCHIFSLTGTCSDGELCRLPHVSMNIINARKSAERRSHPSAQQQPPGVFDELLESSGFTYDSTRPMVDEFYRMCNAFGWRGYSDGREEAKTLFKHILARELLQVSHDAQEDHQTLEDTSETIASNFADLTISITPVVTDAQAWEEHPKHLPHMVPSASHYLKDFFSSFTWFTYDPANAATEEFRRLEGLYNWGSTAAKINVHQRFKDAMVQEFNDIYGTDEESFDAWYALCCVLGIYPPPDTLEGCKERVKETHVNLVDLVSLPNSRRKIKKFHSELALSEYTIQTAKIFPRYNAYAGGLLRFLLRHIYNPPRCADHKNHG